MRDLPVAAIAFSPNGEYLASGSYDNAIKIWDIKTVEEGRSLQG